MVSNTSRIIRIPLTLLVLSLFLAGMAYSSHAQSFNVLYSFGVTDGSQNGPVGILAQGTDGNIYGEVNPDTSKLYVISTSGAESLLWDSDVQYGLGYGCDSGLTVGTDGLLYGTCSSWNYNTTGSGAIFKYDPSHGQLGFTPLYVYPPFGDGGAEYPSPLALGPDGNFYGTTEGDLTNPYGTVFMVTPGGAYTTLHVFQGQAGNDGAYPSGTPLLFASDGNFYGTTNEGGISGRQNGGTLYRITPSGTLTVLKYAPDGYGALVGLTQGQDGNGYGQTSLGGASDQGLIYQLTPTGKVTVLHSFNATRDDADAPDFPLTAGTDGKMYGASESYQSGGYGPESLFQITPSGHYTDLYNGFCNPQSNACIPSSPLLLHTSGTFFGVTEQGGTEGRGTFYSLTNSLSPFVQLQLPVGSVGSSIGIFGQGFAKASAVSFNGTAATYSVVSDTYMTATVPHGATSGYVTVAEGQTSLRSSLPFNVKK